jgi:uncharacterized protein YjbI with pentapeptide repeats
LDSYCSILARKTQAGIFEMKADELLKQYEAGVRDFTGANLSEEDLEGANLEGAILDKARLD